MARVFAPTPRRVKKGKNKVAFGMVFAIATAFLFFWVCVSKSSLYLLGDSISDGVNLKVNTTGSEHSLRSGDGSKHERLPRMLHKDPAFEMNSIPAPEYHLVVSTGCSTYQDWQAYVLFFHAMKSGQVSNGGRLSYATRVVSGCGDEERKKMNAIHEKEIAPIAPGKFFIHHTPLYQFVKPGVNYVYFNKAFGYQHWMENALRYPYNHDKYDNVTYILLDPDQILLRPFSNVFGDENERWGGPFQDKRVVERGQPFAQEYAFGVNFFKDLNMQNIAPSNELPSPVSSLQTKDMFAYMVGPPYIMKGFDLWRLVNKWVEFAPYVYDQRPDHISEMFAYSVAAAHLGLKHQVAHSFMVSNADVMDGEGWRLVQDKPVDDICANVPMQDMPHVLHYCQEYGLGKYFFSKYHLRQDFLSCESPLLKEPPSNLGALYDFMINPGNQKRKLYTNRVVARRNAFAVCHMVKSMNEASLYYKSKNCEPLNTNFNRTLAFFDDMTVE